MTDETRKGDQPELQTAPLEYAIEVKQYGGTVYVTAMPSMWAARPRGEIRKPWRDTDPTIIEVDWSLGGAQFDIEKARAFFNAGLAVCDKLEELAIERGLLPPRGAKP